MITKKRERGRQREREFDSCKGQIGPTALDHKLWGKFQAPDIVVQKLT